MDRIEKKQANLITPLESKLYNNFGSLLISSTLSIFASLIQFDKKGERGLLFPLKAVRMVDYEPGLAGGTLVCIVPSCKPLAISSIFAFTSAGTTLSRSWKGAYPALPR